MSFKHTAAAIEAEGLTHTEKLVLIVLSEYADSETGVCWPSREAVARKAMIAPDTVSRICTQLRDKGFLSIRPRYRANGSRTSNEVVILPPQVDRTLPPPDAGSPPPPTQDRGAPDAGSPPPPTQDRGQNLSLTNLSLEDSLSGAGAQDWRAFDAEMIELAGDAINAAAPAVTHCALLRLLLKGTDDSPACTIDEIRAGVMQAAAWSRKRHGPGKMVNWDTARNIALELRDARIAGHPVKPVAAPAKPARAADAGDPATWTVERWRTAIRVAKQSGQWPPGWGPEPGAPGSFVPDELVFLWKDRAA